MAESNPPRLYTVDYSDRVLRRFREMAKEAKERGDGPTFAAALKEFDRLLRLYPQFGDPQIDLKGETGIIYNGIIPPLSMRYGVYEDHRLVLVVALPALMRLDRPDSSTNE